MPWNCSSYDSEYPQHNSKICFVKPTIHLNIALRGITRLPQKKQEPELLYRHLEVPSTGCSGFRTTSTHNSIYPLRLPEETCLSAERILRRFCSRLWGIPLVSPARRLLFSFILFIYSFFRFALFCLVSFVCQVAFSDIVERNFDTLLSSDYSSVF